MQEMIELSKVQQETPENPPRAVTFVKPSNGSEEEGDISAQTLIAGPAQFGLELNKDVIVS